MGNHIISGGYVTIACMAVAIEIWPRISTESVLTKLALAIVSLYALIQADKFL